MSFTFGFFYYLAIIIIISLLLLYNCCKTIIRLFIISYNFYLYFFYNLFINAHWKFEVPYLFKLYINFLNIITILNRCSRYWIISNYAIKVQITRSKFKLLDYFELLDQSSNYSITSNYSTKVQTTRSFRTTRSFQTTRLFRTIQSFRTTRLFRTIR